MTTNLELRDEPSLQREFYDRALTAEALLQEAYAGHREQKAEILRLEKLNADERYEAGMYKSLYDLWERRATGYQSIIMDMIKTLEALRDDPAVPPWIQTLARGSLDNVGVPPGSGT